MTIYGKMPEYIAHFSLDLPEVMYYLYLPVVMYPISALYDGVRLPSNLECCRPMIRMALDRMWKRKYKYVYLSARKGWATPDNPLNRPGWHCDGFGTDDVNFIWWSGPGTRFANQAFDGIVSDHNRSMEQFNEQVEPGNIVNFPGKNLYMIDPSVVHATPVIPAPGCMRQYVKISMSDQKYNLENNSHNHLFDYNWPLCPREELRNDPARAQLDYVKEDPASI